MTAECDKWRSREVFWYGRLREQTHSDRRTLGAVLERVLSRPKNLADEEEPAVDDARTHESPGGIFVSALPLIP